MDVPDSPRPSRSSRSTDGPGSAAIRRPAADCPRQFWGSSPSGSRSGSACYLLDFPLWWDEAFVAVNLLRRGYLDLLRPLDYGQVCPLLFLWAELTAVRWLGFSEWSLRLFPLACSAASVVLFRVAAGQVSEGRALLLAVAIFAVSVTRSGMPPT